LKTYDFDYVIGSVHYLDGFDPYYEEYWNAVADPFGRYIEKVLECVKLHDDFDALGHINYVCKSAFNPTKKPLRYEDYSDICDEIMKTLAEKGKGMEINTSGFDRVGEFLPSEKYLRRFRELGGEIVTVGSDAHDISRLGQYTSDAARLAADVFGYVCTFEDRKPIFHKL
jgi:histidinol-phosphatase (PHP family)